jgi:hypothetical protein
MDGRRATDDPDGDGAGIYKRNSYKILYKDESTMHRGYVCVMWLLGMEMRCITCDISVHGSRVVDAQRPHPGQE